MARWIAVALFVVSGCGKVAGTQPGAGAPDAGAPDPGGAARHQVGGRVRGLWDGTDGVALRLESDGVNTLLTASANGSFKFASLLDAGTSYTVTVATNPVGHTCVVEAGNGKVADADVANVSIACTGPAVITLSGQWGWRFDPTQDTQMFAGSIAVQDVALTVSGSGVTTANVAGAATTLGQATAPIALPLGSTMVPVAVTATGGLSKTYQLVFDRGKSVLDQVAYGKASNTGAGDRFGAAIALSGDTLAVGAAQESSSSSGINGAQANDSAPQSGAVYVFVRTGTTWAQQAYIKASNTGFSDRFGTSVALSGDTLAVGAPLEASSATGVNGDQTDNLGIQAGAVYVFVRTRTTWSQQAYIKASNTDFSRGEFGSSVALSGDTLAVGAPREESPTTGVNGNQHPSITIPLAGAVYVFLRTGTTWAQQAYIKASNTDADDQFGWSVALSGDTLAVGAPSEGSAATGINGNQDNNSASDSGAVYVFFRAGGTWAQQAYIKASNTKRDYEFGTSVALSGDTLAVGAIFEASAATGVNGNQADTTAFGAGAVYVFIRTGTTWAQQAYIKASKTGTGRFGSSVALSGDALAVGATFEASAATGVNGNQADDAASGAGAVYWFVRTGATWMQHSYVKASNTGANDRFGSSVALSGDALAVGAPVESSVATGVNGSQIDNTASAAGALYIFR